MAHRTIVNRTPVQASYGRTPAARRRMLALAISQLLASTAANAITVTDAGDAGSGCTLREAITSVNSAAHEPGCVGPLSGPITFDPAVTGTITLTQGAIEIRASMTVDGPGRDALTVAADTASQIFRVVNFSEVTEVSVDSLSLAATDVGNMVDGGAIFSSEALSLTDCRISGGRSRAGGAIYSDGFGVANALTLVRCEVTDNYAAFFGGALATKDAVVSISDSTIARNAAGTTGVSLPDDYRSGGALDLLRGSATISGSMVLDNDVYYGYGGAIAASGEVSLIDTVLSANTATSGGGGHLYGYSGDLYLGPTTILGGGQASCGGAAMLYRNDLSSHQATVTGNVALNAAAGLLLSGDVPGSGACAAPSVKSGQRGRRHRTPLAQAGIGGSTTTLTQTTLSGNSVGMAGAGGGLVLDGGTLTLSESTLTDNIAGSGAAVYHRSGELNVSDTTLSANRASNNGGALFTTGSPARVTRSTISGNSASLGGGVYAKLAPSGTLTLDRATIVDNTAVDGGGVALRASAAMSGGTLESTGTLLAQNIVTGSGPDLDHPGADHTLSIAQSLIADGSGSGLTEAPLGSPDGSGSYVGGPTFGVIDPLVGPLADNGGPTETHLPTPDSPLIEHFSGCAARDQRGLTGDQDADAMPGNDCDIGAVDVQNIPVVAVEDNPSADQASGVSGNVLVNDIDPFDEDSGVLAVTAVDGSAGNIGVLIDPVIGGRVSIDALGAYTFDPLGDFVSLGVSDTADVVVPYTVSDGLAADQGQLRITVSGLNDPPSAGNLSAAGTEDSPFNASFQGSDPDASDMLTFAITSLPSQGTVVNNGNGSFRFDPGPDFHDLDAGQSRQVTFMFSASDAEFTSSPATATITISGINDAPVALPVMAMTDEESTVGGTFAGTDAEGGPLTFAVVGAASEGDVMDNGDGSFVFDPQLAFQDLDVNESRDATFPFVANDGDADSAPALVTVTVAGINDPIFADPTAATTDEDSVVVAAFAFSDADVREVPTFDLLSNPSLGSVVNNQDGTFSFDPGLDFQFLDDNELQLASFDFSASDEEFTSASATVRVTVQGINDPPAALASSITTDEDSAVVGPFSGADPEPGDVLAFDLASQPGAGVVTNLNDGQYRFEPSGAFDDLAVGQSRDVQFSFTANDGDATGDPANVTVTVAGVNDAPVANFDSYTITPGDTLNVTALTGLIANDSDVDGDPLSVVAGTFVPAGVGGSLTLNADGSFAYVAPQSVGLARFIYTLTDGRTNVTGNLVINVSNDPTIDLAISKSDGRLIAERGELLVYRIRVTNAGPALALDALVADTLPPELMDGNWSCSGMGGGTCRPAGTGDIAELVDIPVGGEVEFSLQVRFDPGAANGLAVNVATVAAPAGLLETSPADNLATDRTATQTIFGDGFEGREDAIHGDGFEGQ